MNKIMVNFFKFFSEPLIKGNHDVKKENYLGRIKKGLCYG
jgi:hypothetical protein